MLMRSAVCVASTGKLLELRDRALAVAGDSDDVPCLVTVDAELREVLRSQALVGGCPVLLT
jgi:hypothetical protein